MDSLPGWVDLTLIAVLALSMVVGVVRGLIFEVLSLAGWVVAWFVARWGGPLLAPQLPVGQAGSALNLGVAYACAFIGALIVWALLTRLLRLLVRATPLAPVDRVLGAVFGLLRGVLLLLVVATVVAFTPLRHAPAWQQSTGAAWLHAAMQGLKPVLPADISQHLPA